MSLAAANLKHFDTKEDSDVTFIIHDQELHAHQFALINRSPVIKSMIKGPMAPADQRHEINDPEITFEDFENFLKFLYTDKCEIESENVEALLHLGNMYDVPFLFETCVNKLPEFFTPKGKVHIFTWKNFHETTLYKFAELGIIYENKCDIVMKCLKEVPNYAKNSSLQYRKQDQLIWISAELALEFVKNCPRTDAFTENDVFQKVFDWAKGQCGLQNLEINDINLKQFMDPFEPYIKYENLDAKILATTVHEYELIPDKRLLKCYRDHIVVKEPSVVDHIVKLKVVAGSKRKHHDRH